MAMLEAVIIVSWNIGMMEKWKNGRSILVWIVWLVSVSFALREDRRRGCMAFNWTDFRLTRLKFNVAFLSRFGFIDSVLFSISIPIAISIAIAVNHGQRWSLISSKSVSLSGSVASPRAVHEGTVTQGTKATAYGWLASVNHSGGSRTPSASWIGQVARKGSA